MKITKNTIFQYISIFILIFSTDTFVTFANKNENIRTTFFILTLFLLLYILMFKYIRLSRTKIQIWLLMILSILCCMVINMDIGHGNIYIIFLLAFGMILSSVITYDDFKKVFINIMVIICTFSLILYVFTGIIIRYYSYFPIITNIRGTQVICFGVSNVCRFIDEIPRNYGPFWEPGVYAIYLCIALIFSLRAGKPITKREIILMLGVLTTFSTAGIIILFIIFFDYAYIQHIFYRDRTRKNVAQKNNHFKIIFVVITIALAVFAFTNYNIRLVVFSKFLKQDYRYTSTLARLTSISGNLYIWLEHPLFGSGPSKLESLYLSYLRERGYAANSNTNGFLIHFSMYGIINGILYTYCLYHFINLVRQKKTSKLIIFIIFLMMMSTEPLMLSAFFNTIPFYGINKR